MKRRGLILAALALSAAVCSPPAFAQGSDDFNRVEVSAGYSYARVEAGVEAETLTFPDGGSLTFRPCAPEGADFLGADFQRFFCTRRGFNGFDASVTYNVTKYFGIKGNVSGHFKSDRFVDTFEIGPGVSRTDTNTTTERIYNFLAGVQIKDNSKETRFKPYVHALFGVARQTATDIQTSTGPDEFTLRDKETSFAMKLGGGIDVRVSRNVDLRLFEFNYNPIFAGDRVTAGGPLPDPITVTGRTAHNFTFGVGVVFH